MKLPITGPKLIIIISFVLISIYMSIIIIMNIYSKEEPFVDVLLAHEVIDMSGNDIQDNLIEETETKDLFTNPNEDIMFDMKTATLQIPKSIMSEVISQTDIDSELTYIFTYKGNPKPWSRTGLLTVISSIELNDNCEIIIKAADLLAFEITEDDDNIYIHAVTPRDKYNRIVMLDPGHGGKDYGAVYESVFEKDLNLSIAQKAYELFSSGDSGIKAYMTRYGDEAVHVTERPGISNSIADMFISIHCNSFKSSAAYGTSTYFNPDGTADTGRHNISNLDLASILQDSLASALETRDLGLFQSTNIIVLNGALVPAALIEVAYITNDADRNKLLTREFQQDAAQAIYEGIIEAFEYK